MAPRGYTLNPKTGKFQAPKGAAARQTGMRKTSALTKKSGKKKTKR